MASVPTPLYLQRYETKQFKIQIPIALEESEVGNTVPNIKFKLLYDKNTADH
ncbi:MULTISPECIES: hypothetical protein [unclassified Bacillus cereus group]|uniref:hypothetical protein n=1 Tax=unclassified Bacillus cereus group TaxID=2750818 RepID=UPI001F55FACD|nr:MULTISPECIES: hypothetical protein [unclassified Bacillus cereus group]